MSDLIYPSEDRAIAFAGHTYQARRNADDDGAAARWQIFRDDEVTPFGFIEEHSCPYKEGAPGFYVFDTSNRPCFISKPGRDDGCLPHYTNCLLALHIDLTYPNPIR